MGVNVASQTNGNVKQCFLKVQLICEGLMLESEQDMEDFLGSSGIGELSVSEIKRIGSLRVDGKRA